MQPRPRLGFDRLGVRPARQDNRLDATQFYAIRSNSMSSVSYATQKALCALLMLCACSPQKDSHTRDGSQNTALPYRVPLYTVNVPSGAPYYTFNSKRGVLEHGTEDFFASTTALDVYQLQGQQSDETWVVHRDDWGSYRFFRVPVSNLGRILDQAPAMYRAAPTVHCPSMSIVNHNQRLAALGSTLPDQSIALDVFGDFVAFTTSGSLALASRHCFFGLTHSIFSYTESWPPVHLAESLKHFPSSYYAQSFEDSELLDFVSTQIGRGRRPYSEVPTRRRNVVRLT